MVIGSCILKIKEKFKEIYQKSHIGIIICNKLGKILYANKAAFKILKISKLEDITDNNIFDSSYSRKERKY